MRLLKLMGVALLAALAPAMPVVIAAFVLTVTDTVCGVVSARRRGEPLSSMGIRRAIAKLLVYEIAIVLAFLTETYLTGELVPAMRIVAALVGVTELRSVLGHLDEITGGSVFKTILSLLTLPKGGDQ